MPGTGAAALESVLPLLLANGAAGAAGAAGAGVACAYSSNGARAQLQQRLRLVNRAARTLIDSRILSVTISGDRQLSALTAAAAAGRLPGLASIAALASRAADAAALARALPSLARGLPALRRLALRPRPGGAAAPLSGEDGAAAALALAGALCSAPALERLEVEAPGLPQVAAGALAAAALRDLPDLRSLAIGCNLGTDGSEALAAALASEPRAGARLQEVSLRGLESRAIDALAAAPQLAALESLRVAGCAPPPAAAAAAATGAAAAAAAAGGDGVAPPGGDAAAGGGAAEWEALAALSRAPWLGRLVTLCLNDCHIGDVTPLCGGPPASPQPEEVPSPGSKGAGSAPAAAASAPRMRRLRVLSLAGNRLGAAAAGRLAAAPLPRLSRLDLSRNPLGAAAAAALAASPWARARLEALSLAGTRAGDAGFASIAAAPLVALAELDFSDDGVTDASVAALAASAWLPCGLVALDISDRAAARGPLYNTRLGRDGAAWRKAAAAEMPRLRRLDLRRTCLGAGAAAQLAAARWLAQLVLLRLPELIEPDALSALREGAAFRALEAAGRVRYGDGGGGPVRGQPAGGGGGGGPGALYQPVVFASRERQGLTRDLSGTRRRRRRPAAGQARRVLGAQAAATLLPLAPWLLRVGARWGGGGGADAGGRGGGGREGGGFQSGSEAMAAAATAAAATLALAAALAAAGGRR